MHVRMTHPGHETHVRRRERVVVRYADIQLPPAAFVGGASRALEDRCPVVQFRVRDRAEVLYDVFAVARLLIFVVAAVAVVVDVRRRLMRGALAGRVVEFGLRRVLYVSPAAVAAVQLSSFRTDRTAAASALLLLPLSLPLLLLLATVSDIVSAVLLRCGVELEFMQQAFRGR